MLLVSLGRQARLDKEKAKKYYFLAVVYLIIGFGVCGILLSGF